MEIIRLVLIFILFIGILFIFQDKFDRLLISNTNTPKASSNTNQSSTNSYTTNKTTLTTRHFSEKNYNTKINFSGGTIVTTSYNSPINNEYGEALHTISGKFANYKLRTLAKNAGAAFPASPYAGTVVFLDRTVAIKKNKSADEYLVLLSTDFLNEPIDITNWTLVDKKTLRSYKIPKGIHIFGNLKLQKNEKIRIESGQAIIVSTGRSPVGHSFFVNKCTGYRTQFKFFNPSIKTQCPNPIDELVLNNSIPFSDFKCYKYVENLSSCTTVTRVPTKVSKACSTFLKNTITESACVEKHRNDPDFFSQEWRIFLGQKDNIWSNKNNIIYLLDKDKRLVASLIYQ